VTRPSAPGAAGRFPRPAASATFMAVALQLILGDLAGCRLAARLSSWLRKAATRARSAGPRTAQRMNLWVDPDEPGPHRPREPLPRPRDALVLSAWPFYASPCRPRRRRAAARTLLRSGTHARRTLRRDYWAAEPQREALVRLRLESCRRSARPRSARALVPGAREIKASGSRQHPRQIELLAGARARRWRWSTRRSGRAPDAHVLLARLHDGRTGSRTGRPRRPAGRAALRRRRVGRQMASMAAGTGAPPLADCSSLRATSTPSRALAEARRCAEHLGSPWWQPCRPRRAASRRRLLPRGRRRGPAPRRAPVHARHGYDPDVVDTLEAWAYGRSTMESWAEGVRLLAATGAARGARYRHGRGSVAAAEAAARAALGEEAYARSARRARRSRSGRRGVREPGPRQRKRRPQAGQASRRRSSTSPASPRRA